MAPLVLADELKYAEQVVPQNVNRYNNLKDKTIALKTAHNQYIVAESNGEANANRQYRGLFEEFKVEVLGNFKIALKSVYNKYLVAELNGEANANRDKRDTWETFTIEFVDENRVALKSFHNKYIIARNDGRLNANATQMGPWETFTLEIITSVFSLNWNGYTNLIGKTIALKSVHNRYIVAESNGELNANRTAIGLFEEFKVKLGGNFLIAIKSAHNKYLVAESNGQVNANRDKRGPWEVFSIEFVDASRVALKSFHNKYLIAEDDGRLNANADQRGPWEIFKLEIIPPDSDLQRCINLNGKMIALKSVHHRYVVAEVSGEANANRAKARLYEEFKFEYLGNFKIALKTIHNKYLVAESTGEANANREMRDTWETFTIEFVDANRVALKSFHNKYLVAEDDGRLNANRDQRGPWETFTLAIISPAEHWCNRLDSTIISLQTYNNRFIGVSYSGFIKSDYLGRAGNVEFKLEYLGDLKVAFYTMYDKYLVAESNGVGRINANRAVRGIQETFTISFVDEKPTTYESRPTKIALRTFQYGYLLPYQGYLISTSYRGPKETFKLLVIPENEQYYYKSYISSIDGYVHRQRP